MVSAVSSQAATLNPLAYTALDGDDNARQPASNATPTDSDRGPATQVSLSRDALDRVKAAFKQSPDAAQQAVNALSQAGEDRFQAHMQAMDRRVELMKINAQLRMLDWREETNNSLASTIKSMRESAIKWQNTTPVPAVQLSHAEISAILKKVAPRGIDPSKIGGADTYSFGDDGKIYTFLKDGTAWVNEGGVPTSEEQKQRGYQAFNETMLYLSTRIENPGVSRADLIAKRNALMVQ
ncbi:hypothetical protein [Bradyrhizobium sp. sBnM-33]|uniref:hypothetical protein n=1 Tax=Bradyrhizobium sp. sBnM-33 TaxID=2831780 RepID=UPI001BCF57BF|nr:hypothetical protein [Bradyrhizobium sp. sBnM-33]WOH48671.1 hypothetical protein RX328_31935 [Bradyrhizobium sp. sBnM-33]